MLTSLVVTYGVIASELNCDHALTIYQPGFVGANAAKSVHGLCGLSRTDDEGALRGRRVPRQSEVEHLHGAIRSDLDIRRLQIAMDDSLLMRSYERRDAIRFFDAVDVRDVSDD